MKTRGQLYSQEVTRLLRDISMYRAMAEGQLLRLYPKKESKIKGLLSYLTEQGRIVQRGELYFASPGAVNHVDKGLLAALWVLADFSDQVEFHSVGDFPVKIIFIANGEIYEIVRAEEGREALLAYVMGRGGEEPSHYIVLVDSPEQITGLDLPNTCGYCTVAPNGEVQYYQKE